MERRNNKITPFEMVFIIRDIMTDYKQMYLELIRGTERAINTLIDAQRRCEELYISAPEAEITILPSKEAKTDKQQ